LIDHFPIFRLPIHLHLKPVIPAVITEAKLNVLEDPEISSYPLHLRICCRQVFLSSYKIGYRPP